MKRVLLPTFCFAVLSTVAFQEEVLATQADTVVSERVFKTTVKYVNVNSGFLNLRASTSTSATVLATLIKGTEVTVHSEANGWSKIKVNGKEGYVSSSYLTAEKPAASATPSPPPASEVKTQTKYVKVNSGSLNVRSSASTGSSIVTTVKKNEEVTVYSEANGWSKIKVNGKEGYVSSSYLTATKPAASATPPPPAPEPKTQTKYVKVNSGSLNVRSSASTSSSIVTTVKKDEEVTVYSETNGWSKIKVNGKEGYVSSSYLTATKPAASTTPLPAPEPKTQTKYVKVNSGSLNVRSSASTSSSIVTTVKKDEEVTVYSEANGWSKIKVNGKEGYVSSSYLTATKPAASTTPLPAPEPKTQTKYVKVNSGSLNVRSSASTSSSIVTTVKKDEEVTVYSEANGWSKVKVNGKEGYVSSDYLAAEKPEASKTSPPLPSPSTPEVKTETKYVKIRSGSLNVRSSASTSASIVTTVKKNEEVIVYSEANGWSKVKVNGKEGYVSSSYLTTTKPETSTSPSPPSAPEVQTETKYVKIRSGSLNVRSSASTSSSIVTTVKKDEEVIVYSEANGWSKVKVNGKEGYVSSSYLTTTKPETSASPSAPEVKIETKYVNITSGSLNVRSGASASASIVATVKRDEEVIVYSEANGWSKIKVNGKEGYVSSSYLTAEKPGTNITSPTPSQPAEPETKYVNVSSGSLNMRNSASASASIIVQLAKGKEVKVYSESNGWAKIEAFGQTGYVSSQYLSIEKPNESNGTTPEVTTTKYVNVSTSLNVRESASLSGRVLVALTKGTEVTVYSESNGWAKIAVNGQVGYVSSPYLSDMKPPAGSSPESEQTLETKYVNVSIGSSLNMRNHPSADSSIIVKLARGTEVTVYSEEDGWAEIKVYEQLGYVSSDYLSSEKPTAGTELSPEDSLDSSDEHAVDEVSKYVNVIYGSTLNMRTEPTVSATIITKLSRGEVVTVHSEENDWAKVTINGQTGYVSSQYLSSTEPYSPNIPDKNEEKIIEQYPISLKDLTAIQMAVKPQTDKKYQTYIREDALVLTSSSSGTVKGTNWNIRGGAGTGYWVVGTVKSGTNLPIISKVMGNDGYYWYQIDYNKSWVNASPEDVSYYLNPTNFLSTTVDSLQFLKLSVSANLNVNEVNERILAGKGILEGTASAFVTAGEMYNVNEVYLIAHALLETGKGTSQLAKGVNVNGKTVYNMYGIGAYDGTALASGAQYAYNAGWFTPEAAIIGGAKFIAQGYIGAGQDTLYKMRWNPSSAILNGYASHQYATDIGWAAKQVNQIHNLYNLIDSYTLVLDIPTYQ